MAFNTVMSLLLCMLWKLRCPRPPTNILVTRYGRSALSTYRELEKTHQKVDKLELDVSFLHRCHEYNIIPKFLRFKIYDRNFNNTDTYRDWQKSLLEREIRIQTQKLNELKGKLIQLKDSFKNLVSYLDFWTFFMKIKEHTRHISDKIRTRHERKLRYLGIHPVVYDERSIFNYSSRLLNGREKRLLSLGLDFCIPFYKTDWLKHFYIWMS